MEPLLFSYQSTAFHFPQYTRESCQKKTSFEDLQQYASGINARVSNLKP